MAAKTFVFNEDRIIYWTLIVSCLGHVCFLALAYFIIPPVAKAKIKSMEIRYQPKSKDSPEKKPAKIESVSDLRESRKTVRDLEAAKLVQQQLSGAAFLKDTIVRAQRVDVRDKQPLKMTNLVEKRSITVPVVASQKITNPKYVGYNDRIRDKIRNRAYFYIDDPKFQAGEVYLTFVVTADGNLKDLQIINDRSNANDYLRTFGLRSVKESSPFPPFPADLPYPELSFNVVISFEVSPD